MAQAAEDTAAEPAAQNFELAISPSHLIHRAQQFAADRYAQALAESAITQRQFAVLNAVAANEGLTQTDLVRATGIDRSTLAELVARMSRRNLIVRTRAASDARANTVRLTDAGRDALNDATPLVAETDAAILEALPKSKRGAFIEALQRIARVLDEEDDTAPPAPAPEKPKKGKKKAAKAEAQPAKTTKAEKKSKGRKTTKSAKLANPKKAAEKKKAK